MIRKAFRLIKNQVYNFLFFFFLAINAVNALHGRFFSGRTVVGNYIPTQSYHKLFPESSSTTTPLNASY
jgi:hypothetical protein